MANSKINFKLGHLDFSGEGDPKWVAAQLDKILARASEIIESQYMGFDHVDQSQTAAYTATHTYHSVSESIKNEEAEPHESGANGPDTAGDHRIMNVGLAQYLKDLNAGASQVMRFLATAQWLHKRGNRRPTTRDVTNALRDHEQKGLSNPADCLNKNVKKEFCKKDGKTFHVTAAGRTALRVHS